MKKYKISKYMIYEQNNNNEYILYNSLNGSIIKLKDQYYIELFKKIIVLNEIDIEDNEFYKMLIDNKYLIDIDRNELLDIKTMYQEKIVCDETLHLMLIMTRNCNFNCVYCGQTHYENEKLDEKKVTLILTAIERLLEIKSYKHIHISFFGGEPLLEYKLMMIFLENIKEISNKYNMSYSASVTTNGYLLTKKRVESLCKYNCNYYQITIDGMDYTHNKTRMKKDGGKTWDIIMQNIYNCLELDLNFKILLRTNYNYEVIDSIIEFYEYIHN